MGMCTSRNNNQNNNAWKKDSRVFIQKMKLLQHEINAVLQRREEDSEAYERELMLFALKEAEWKRERKKLREEVKRLRKRVEEKEDKIRTMEEEVDQIVVKTEQFEGKSSVESSGCTGTTGTVSLSLMEQIKEERARRDETVEKWKMLYLAIKNELDDLIQKTHQGTIYWRADEEELAEELQRELKAKDEIIEVLKAQVTSMENDEYKRKREVDILRQSLKIISNKKGTPSAHQKNKSSSKPLIRLNKSLPKFIFVN